MGLRVGIQGQEGSSSHQAAELFCLRNSWPDVTICYLTTTLAVVEQLTQNEIDYGVFAWASSRSGVVEETKEALTRYVVEIIDDLSICPDHVLLSRNPGDVVSRIISHPQALKEHAPFLRREYPSAIFVEETDTALAAEKLAAGKYQENSLVIAPRQCAKIYDLHVFVEDLPTNEGYVTTFYLARPNSPETPNQQ